LIKRLPTVSCMSRCCIAFAVTFLFFLSCKTTSTVQKIQADSTAIYTKVFIDSIYASALAFETLSAKAKVVVQQGEGTTEFTAYIRMRSDSAIWLSISPALGIEVARILITTDSVRIIDRLNNEYTSRGFDFFTSFTAIPVSFSEIQSMLLGIPVFTQRNSFQLSSTDSSFQLFYSDSSFTNTILLDRSFNLKTQLLKVTGKGSLMIAQEQYDETYNPAFSLWRKVEAVTTQPASFEITFTKVRFNEPLTFPFKVE